MSNVPFSSDSPFPVGNLLLDLYVTLSLLAEELDEVTLVKELNKRKGTLGRREAPSSVSSTNVTIFTTSLWSTLFMW